MASPRLGRTALIVHVQQMHNIHFLDKYNKIYKMKGTYIKQVYNVTDKQNYSAR